MKKMVLSFLLTFCLFACKDVNNSSNMPINSEQKDPNTFEVGRLKVEMVLIDAIDEIVLGKQGSQDNPPHKVSLSAYRIAKKEVTQELFDAIYGDGTQWHFTRGFNKQRSLPPIVELPADRVSWYKAVAFCNMLTLKIDGLKDEVVYYSDEDFTKPYTKEDAENKQEAYANWKKKGFRLPTEAEWEVAAKAKDENAIYSGANGDSDDELKEVAWMGLNSENKTHDVGQKKANAYGLFDMTGNVLEWCWDWYKDIEGDLTNIKKDPRGPLDMGDSIGRAMRGGAYIYPSSTCRIQYRDAMVPDGIIPGYPDTNYKYLGFRLAMSL